MTEVCPESLDLKALPNVPGVYYFFRDDTLLYVGKSIDIKQRVLSHSYSAKSDNKEARLMGSTNRIEYTVTPGELSALLLESTEIKSRKPLYNRRLRRKTNLLSWHYKTDKDLALHIDSHCWPPEEGTEQFGLYRNRWQATNEMKAICREYKLCEQRLGLSKANRKACFGYQVGKCLGVCAEAETPEAHDKRLFEALAEKNFNVWPFAGPIAIQESEASDQLVVIHKWFMYGHAKSPSDAKQLVNKEGADTVRILNLDDYRIVLSFLKQKKYQRYFEVAE